MAIESPQGIQLTTITLLRLMKELIKEQGLHQNAVSISSQAGRQNL